MSITVSFIKYIIIALVSYLYSEFVVHLVGFVDYGDLLKYSDLYQGLSDITNPLDIYSYQLLVIGSADPLYSFVLRLFVPYFDFLQFIWIQTFIFIFLFASLFFHNQKCLFEPFRYIFFLGSLFSIYTLGLSTTLIRLALCFIFIFLSEIYRDKLVFRNLLLLLALLIHISSFFIIKFYFSCNRNCFLFLNT